MDHVHLVNDFQGTISTVSPNNGPFSGSNLVTISGYNLGSGSDITAVFLAGTEAFSIISQNATSVVVIAGVEKDITNLPRNGDVVVFSASQGSTILADAYTVLNRGITVVSPDNGPLLGNNSITVYGRNLGDGVDITSVMIHNQTATILTQTIDTVAVRVPAPSPAIAYTQTVDIVVTSTSQGYTSLLNGYTFYSPFPVAGILILVIVGGATVFIIVFTAIFFKTSPEYTDPQAASDEYVQLQAQKSVSKRRRAVRTH